MVDYVLRSGVTAMPGGTGGCAGARVGLSTEPPGSFLDPELIYSGVQKVNT